MSLLKKTNFRPNEIPIYDEAIIYPRGKYWQFRMWLEEEGKYARFSLRTTTQSTAIDEAKQRYHELMVQQKQGKTYFSKTTKQGVDDYLAHRWKDVEEGNIVKGRHATIKTHLDHWLNFIKRDAKLKNLKPKDCEGYFSARSKTKKGIAVSRTTLLNEQSTINAMMHWLYEEGETHIESFKFKKLPRIDRGDEDLRRSSFTDEEVKDIVKQLTLYIADAKKKIGDDEYLVQAITGYYLLVSLITGLRRGEQLQLRWQDIEFLPNAVHGKAGKSHDLVQITVRGETSKVRKTRKFAVRDEIECFDDLLKLLRPRFIKHNKAKDFPNSLIFSSDGHKAITARAIAYHFEKIIGLAKIKNVGKRNLVPYSFRHNFITEKVNQGLSPIRVAEMCGTSATQIERTYYHMTKETMLTNAVPGYTYRDGVLIPK